MSLFFLVFGIAALVAVAAAPLSIDLSFHPRATADHDGHVVVRGIVTCSIETTVDIEVEVVEPLNRSQVAGGGATAVTCSTTPTPWTTVVPPDAERRFQPGFATVAVRAVGFDPEHGIFAGVESVGFLHLTRSGN